jgi:hypothetical protein
MEGEGGAGGGLEGYGAALAGDVHFSLKGFLGWSFVWLMMMMVVVVVVAARIVVTAEFGKLQHRQMMNGETSWSPVLSVP